MDFTELLLAYKSCRIGKLASSHQTRFESKLGENLLDLVAEINNRKYKPSRSICFVVLHPKPREIFAAHFRDRIIRHLKPLGYMRYMDDLTLLHTDKNFLEPLIEPIDQWLKINRHQELNQAKTALKSLKSGIEYLGYHIKQEERASNPLQLYYPPSKKWVFIQDISKLEKEGLPSPTHLHPLAAKLSRKHSQYRLSSINSRLGMMKHAESYLFRKETLLRLRQNTAFVNMDLNTEDTYYWDTILSRKNFTSVKLR